MHSAGIVLIPLPPRIVVTENDVRPQSSCSRGARCSAHDGDAGDRLDERRDRVLAQLRRRAVHRAALGPQLAAQHARVRDDGHERRRLDHDRRVCARVVLHVVRDARETHLLVDGAHEADVQPDVDRRQPLECVQRGRDPALRVARAAPDEAAAVDPRLRGGSAHGVGVSLDHERRVAVVAVERSDHVRPPRKHLLEHDLAPDRSAELADPLRDTRLAAFRPTEHRVDARDRDELRRDLRHSPAVGLPRHPGEDELLAGARR